MSDGSDRGSAHAYECMVCEHRIRAYGPAFCPNCGEEMKNLSQPSANGGRSGPSY